MHRTTLSLPDELADALKREARRRDTSVSAVARDALNERFGVSGRPRRVGFAAIGNSGHTDTAARSEELLAEMADEIEEDAFGGRRRR